MTPATEKNIAFATLNSYVVYVGGKRPPRDDEWMHYLDALEQAGMIDGVARRYLIITDGGSPTLAQQKIMHERIHRALAASPGSLKAALVTPSTFARGVGVALTQQSPIFKLFRPEEMPDVYAYLGIPPAFVKQIERLVESLRATLTP